MCSVCLKSPCDVRCPNAKSPRSYAVCESCGEVIALGDEFAEINGEYYHVDCLENMGARELIGLFDCYTHTVCEEDFE